MKNLSLKLFGFLLILLAIPFFNLQAQTSSSNINLSISISPESPAPGDQVTVSLQSFSLDLDRSTITWSVNGRQKQTEVGLKTYYLQAGTAGTPMTASARIETREGTVINKEVTFIPAGVDLLFEAVSYVPPFYKGKALNVNQGTVVVVAFPEIFTQGGKKFATNELIFNWKKDDVVIPSVSGIGKNYLTFSGTVPIRDAKIYVKATSMDQSISAEREITITTGSPKIVFYENSPIYGIMTNKAIRNTVQLLSDEFSVLAAPYFFSVGYDTTPDLDYAWTLNGQSVENQEPKNSFTVRQETKGAGTADIGLKISNNVRIFQFTDNKFIINFQKQ
jgi:hypothetical protein